AGGSERLFDEDMLAGAQRRRCQVEVRGDRRGNRNRVDPRVLEQLSVVHRQLDRRVAPLDNREPLGPQIADASDLHARRLVEIANQIRSPVAITNQADPNHPDILQYCYRPSRTAPSRAGTPWATVCGGTSLVTTAPAPTIAPSPMVTPARMTAPLPIDARLLTRVGTTFQSASVCSAPPVVARR